MALPRRIAYRKYFGGSWMDGLSTTGDPAVQATLQKSRDMQAQAAAAAASGTGALGKVKVNMDDAGLGKPNKISPGATQGFAALAGIGAGALNASNMPSDYGHTNVGKSIGSGALSGAATGATLGSFLPGYGTIIGGAVGAVVGGAYAGIKSGVGNRKADKLQSRDNIYKAEAKRAMDAQRYLEEPAGGVQGRQWFARRGGQIRTQVPYMKTRPVFQQPSYLKMADGGEFAPESYYKDSATLQHYKEVLNERLKAKNPEAYTNYFKGMQGATDRNAYIQNTPYNEYLSPDEVKSTLGNDYGNYTSSLSAVNQYDVSQGKQPLYGTVEGEKDVSNLNYGRRFASLRTTPSIGVGGVYSRNYGYNPATKSVDVTETGNTERRPAGFYPPNTAPAPPPEEPSTAKMRKGGGIHINPKNKGKFNALKKRTGKSTEELTHSKNPLTRKRAVFAQNAKKWKH